MHSLLDRPKMDLGYPDLRTFSYEHLPSWLQAASKPFGDLARDLWENAPICHETGVALRKLLEAKDAAVRAVVLRQDDEANAEIEAEADRLAGQPDEPVAGTDDI